ncbi:unnamed protein product [Cuscuta campestris]|uniref:WDR11 second beta-propeller domain-containing protein n=1 Tax=Cuscuta campestris TaxID=132261 RepID=A0A484NH65_9ASTE|nr:unnamed protein product [Cuscuta campestris]
MNDVVFVMTNSKLAKKKKAKRSNPLKLEDLSSDDEWIMEDVGEDPGGDEVAAGNNSTDVPTQNGEEEAAGNNSKDVPTQNGQEEAAANVQPEHEEELDVTNLDEGDEDEDEDEDKELEDYDFSIDNYVLDVLNFMSFDRPKWASSSFAASDGLVTAMAYRLPHVAHQVMGMSHLKSKHRQITSPL